MRPPAIPIRPETPNDAAAIDAVTIAAFEKAPYSDHREQFIVRALRASGSLTLSLVVVLDTEIVGHLALSPVSLSDGASRWFGLGPLSVLPAHQNRGIGSALVREALRRLKDSGAAGCVVLGEPAYYGRFGFRAGDELILPHFPAKYFQAIAFGADAPRGVVTYHPAFSASE